MKLGFMEILVIFVVALIVIGPDKLPEAARKLGAALKSFREATGGITQELRTNVVEPLNEAQAPLREALEPLNEMADELQKEVKELTEDVNQLGKAPEKKTAEPAAVPEEEEPAAEAGDPGTGAEQEAPAAAEAPVNPAEETASETAEPAQTE